jgi:hypothetical protein
VRQKGKNALFSLDLAAEQRCERVTDFNAQLGSAFVGRGRRRGRWTCSGRPRGVPGQAPHWLAAPPRRTPFAALQLQPA